MMLARSPATPQFNGGARVPPSPHAYSSKGKRRAGAPRLPALLLVGAALCLAVWAHASVGRAAAPPLAQGIWQRDVAVEDLPALRLSEAALDAAEARAAAAAAAFKDSCRIHVIDTRSPLAARMRLEACDIDQVRRAGGL
jgi:hypothetical protein